jgi:hypothetical protein
MCTLFYGGKRILFVVLLPQGSTFHAGVYCNTLKKFRHAIQNKRRDMFSRGVVMLHDNARPHTATTTQDLFKKFGWEQFDYPPYSPDLAPSDFHVFLHLKSFFGGCSSTMAMRSKKLLTCGLHHRWYHSMMQEYKNWCPAMTSASAVVEAMLKSSVQYVHPMAI